MAANRPEIVEVDAPEPTAPPLPESVEEDHVYVAVGKGATSSDALAWALDNMVRPGTTVFLVHVCPEVHSIPTPLGMLPKSRVSASQIENYMIQTRHKTRELLLPFINMCRISKVNYDTVILEYDNIVKAIIGLIPVLQIRKLVIGSTKSSLRRTRRGSAVGKAVQIQTWAMEYCELKIICDKREVSMDDIVPSSPQTPRRDISMTEKVLSTPPTPEVSLSPLESIAEMESEQHSNATTCRCFRRRF